MVKNLRRASALGYGIIRPVIQIALHPAELAQVDAFAAELDMERGTWARGALLHPDQEAIAAYRDQLDGAQSQSTDRLELNNQALRDLLSNQEMNLISARAELGDLARALVASDKPKIKLHMIELARLLND